MLQDGHITLAAWSYNATTLTPARRWKLSRMAQPEYETLRGGERAAAIEALRAGHLRALVNVNTTNCPNEPPTTKDFRWAKDTANQGGLYFPDSGYFAGFRVDEVNLSTAVADYCLEKPISTFGRVIVNFVPDLQIHSS